MKIENICGIECKVFESGDDQLLLNEKRTIFWKHIKCWSYWKYIDCEIENNPEPNNCFNYWLNNNIYTFAVPVDDTITTILHNAIPKCIRMTMNDKYSFTENLKHAKFHDYIITDAQLYKMLDELNQIV